jgi:hypothetical protein
MARILKSRASDPRSMDSRSMRIRSRKSRLLRLLTFHRLVMSGRAESRPLPAWIKLQLALHAYPGSDDGTLSSASRNKSLYD